MNNIFVTEEDREESILERRDRERQENGRVENDEPVPLIPNIKGDVRKTITGIEVWKQDPPNDGYRGTIPTVSDFSTVAKLYGNGLYEFRAVSAEGKVLRRNQVVRISYTATDSGGKQEQSAPVATEAPDLQLLRWQAEQHAADSRRIEDFGRMSVETTRDMARANLDAQARQHEAAIARDREYHRATMEQQQTFFQYMMLQMNMMHQQQMERADRSNALVVSVVQKASDPTALLSVFQQGLMLSQGMAAQEEEDDDEPEPEQPWVKAIEAGAGMVRDLVDIKRTQIAVPAKSPQAAAPTPVLPQQPATEQKPPSAPKKRPKVERLFTKSELAAVIRAKHIMQQKGLDFEGTVNNALMYIVQGAGIDSGEPTGETPPESSDSAARDA